MAKIRKLYDETIKPDGSKQVIYPITSTRAVYTTSNVTMDRILNEGYRFGGVVLPTDTPTITDQRVFYGASVPGVYTSFGNIAVDSGEAIFILWDGEQWTKGLFGGASFGTLTGFKALETLAQLPLEETQFGYLINEHLYVWVGENGDTLDGFYQDCGELRGASAYEVAVRNGYEGTEEEWLNDPNGAKGISVSDWNVEQSTEDSGTSVLTITLSNGESTSVDIKNGKGIVSVDQIATSEFSGGTNRCRVTYSDGTTSDFTFLNGERGIQGPTGPQGLQGAAGLTGPKGDKGDKGDSGVSLGDVVLTTSIDETETGKALDASAIQNFVHFLSGDESDEIEEVPSNYYNRQQIDTIINDQQRQINDQNQEIDDFKDVITDIVENYPNVTYENETTWTGNKNFNLNNIGFLSGNITISVASSVYIYLPKVSTYFNSDCHYYVIVPKASVSDNAQVLLGSAGATNFLYNGRALSLGTATSGTILHFNKAVLLEVIGLKESDTWVISTPNEAVELVNSGVSSNRPSNDLLYAGFTFFDTTLGKMIVWDGTAWVNMDGSPLLAHAGTTAQRPSASDAGVGFTYFDTDLGKMIVSDGTDWVNMDGTALS